MSDLDATPVDGVAVEINGHEVIAAKGELLIDAAERAGTYIPRFCYHERMKPVGMCRMCIVEVDTGRGPALQPSCMIECTPGMKVDTESPATKKAQDGVLEFLLANHPLDCPVCDKGGECPLQDQTMAYGPGESRYVEEKRHKEKPIPISDLVLLDRERCILCDRCTRFAKDVAGDPLIHFINRGNDTEVNTFPDHPFASYFSGNVVQICPVGALTASTYRFKARPWDLETTESTCQTCSVGCRISIDSSRDAVQRYAGVDIDPVNWGWLCDKGRFANESVSAEGRLTDPLVRSGDALAPARWADAMSLVATSLGAVSPDAIGVIGGARLTNEDAYAWARLFKGVIGTDNVDAQLGDGLPAETVLGLPGATIDEVCAPGGTVLLIAPDVKEELPVLFLRLRHAVVEDGVTVIEISPRSTAMSSLARVSMQPRPGELGALVGALFDASSSEVAGVDASVIAAARAALSSAAGPLRVVLGRGSIAESTDVVLDAASRVLAAHADAAFLPVLRRANVRGAMELGLAPGMLPGRVTLDEGREWFSEVWSKVPAARGLDTTGILRAAAAGRIDVLVLLGADPLADFPDADLAERAIAGARTVIAVDTVLNASSRRADVVLAASGFAEKAGTTTNIEGRVSVLSQRVTPPGTARPDWMLAAELGARLGDDAGFGSVADVLEELSAVSPAHLALDQALSDGETDGVLLPLDVVVVTEQIALDGDAVAVELDVQVSDDDGSDEGAAIAVETVTDVVAADEPAAVPAFVSFQPVAPVAVPPMDSYGLRLIATRALYDLGTLVQSAPALAGLARGTGVRLNPYDHDRLGGPARVSVRSERATMVLALHADAGVPRGAAAIVVNQAEGDVTRFIDIDQPVTELRIETAS